MNKNKIIKVYVSEEELKFINNMAKEYNISSSTYLRQLGLQSRKLLKPEEMCEIVEILNSMNSKYSNEWMQQKTNMIYKKLGV